MGIIQKVTMQTAKLMPKDLTKTTGMIKEAVQTGWQKGKTQSLIDNKGLTSDMYTRSKCVAKELKSLKFTKDDIPALAAALGYVIPIPIPGLTFITYGAGILVKKALQIAQKTK